MPCDEKDGPRKWIQRLNSITNSTTRELSRAKPGSAQELLWIAGSEGCPPKSTTRLGGATDGRAYFLRVERSCIQTMSGLFGWDWFRTRSFLIGGVVRPSTHLRISAWPSPNEKPPARLW